MRAASGVRVVLGKRPVADHKQLNVLKEPRSSPETVALVAVDLVERLPDVNAAPFQFDVD